MIRFIVNADDLGLTEARTEAVMQFLKVGCISSASIMANSSHLSTISSLIQEYPNASFGIHLNITEGRALTEKLQRYDLTDSSGDFRTKHNVVFDFRQSPQALLDAVEEEWDAQIDRLKSYGISPSHVDGHHHCHTFPGLENVLLRVMRTHGLTKVRNTYNWPNPTFRHFIKRHLVHARENAFSLFCRQNGLQTTRYFGGFDEIETRLRGAHTCWLGNAVIECMCHPGHPDYAAETEHVRSSRLPLISWNDL
ncbi:MAG: ChbG/HpnK family deacetylase [Bacteroidales bacterium]|nr:ChbG/HpnK family deacetylase [Bacteroidales bacterium]